MEKRLLQIGLGILAVILVWKIWHPLWRMDLNEAPAPSNETKVIFEIEKGSAAKHIANDLEDAGLIVNKKSFLRTLEDEGTDGDLRYGSFVLSPSMTLREVITLLTTEGSGEYAVRILEGWTIDEIDAHLTEMGLINAGEYRACTYNCEFDHDFLEGSTSLEGFLFPDTYFTEAASFDVESFIEQQLDTFDLRFDEEMEAALASSGRTWQETINVASMIEKEVRTDADLPIVSGIIWKRYDNNWMLGIDATLLYVQADNVLTAADLAQDTPYNTRINTGLPPTPISNPGLASIQAALYPEDSEYWFYLTTLDTGEVIYAVTNAEHEANKDTYL